MRRDEWHLDPGEATTDDQRVIRNALRLFGLVTALFFGSALVLGAVGAGPDAPMSTSLTPWVDLARIGVSTTLGPFRLGAPRLAASACSEDGRHALLTFESPITSEQSLVLAEFPPGPAVATLSFATSRLASPSEAGVVDQAWCGRVTRWEPTLPTP